MPVIGCITINKTTAYFSCKKEVSLTLWEAKVNRTKGKSDEDLQILSFLYLGTIFLWGTLNQAFKLFDKIWDITISRFIGYLRNVQVGI